MNEIESMYMDSILPLIFKGDHKFDSGKGIHMYIVDFIIDNKFIVEIDGHESHKTKQQRTSDYMRERYLMEQGYFIIRFTGSEVFVDADKCAEETMRIIKKIGRSYIQTWEMGYESGNKKKGSSAKVV